MLHRFGLTFLLVFQSFLTLQAQIGRDFADPGLKGPVVRLVDSTYSKVTIDSAGKLDMSEAMVQWSVGTVEEGHTIAMESFMGFQGESRSMGKIEIEREGEQIREIRYYSGLGDNLSLWRKSRTTYRDGRIATETVVDRKGEVLATLEYAYGRSPRGNVTVSMTQYKPDLEGPQGHYFLEHDSLGKVMHIESVGRDTGIYLERTMVQGDSLQEHMAIGLSSRTKGERDTAYSRYEIERDRYGNPVRMLITIQGTEDGEPFVAHMLKVINYTYEGESTPEPAPMVLSREGLRGKWSNRADNFSLQLGGPFNSTTASTVPIRSTKTNE